MTFLRASESEDILTPQFQPPLVPRLSPYPWPDEPLRPPANGWVSQIRWEPTWWEGVRSWSSISTSTLCTGRTEIGEAWDDFVTTLSFDFHLLSVSKTNHISCVVVLHLAVVSLSKLYTNRPTTKITSQLPKILKIFNSISGVKHFQIGLNLHVNHLCKGLDIEIAQMLCC